MATHPQPYGAPPARNSAHLAWLLSLPVAVLVSIFVAELAREWRWTTNHFPLDPGPVTDLLIVAGASGVAMLIGLGLFVTRNAAVGAWLFVLGVALVCGAAVGFYIGPVQP